VPHQLCHFHYLREAAKPVAEADRHAKKELNKRVRGVRPIERAAEAEEDVEAEVVRGYCAAVRAALTDDGLPPLSAAGLKLLGRLEKVVASLERVCAQAGGLPKGLQRLRQLLQEGLEDTAPLWPPVKAAYRWVHRVAHLLENEKQRPAAKVRRGLSQRLTKTRQAKDEVVAGQLRHFVKVTKSYWPGLFRCYESADIPRTNNDLEHLFGSHRYHERRASGRKRGSMGLAVKGGPGIVAGLATRQRPGEGLALPPGYVVDWQQARAALEKRRESRRQQRRFRRDPDGYLQRLEKVAQAPRPLRTPEARPLTLRLLGGLILFVTTLYCGPAARTGKGRGREGGGLYPELAALGISEGPSPALVSLVGRQCALLPSYELARQEGERGGGVGAACGGPDGPLGGGAGQGA
jgi:hypothetical protein